jgi:hypothetical protein
MRKFAAACFTLIAVGGCSQSIGPDLAACKNKAIELARASGVDTGLLPDPHVLELRLFLIKLRS